MPTPVTCPHCGNADPATIQHNGLARRDPRYTLLCVARVRIADATFDALDCLVGHDGLTSCGMQWSPNQLDGFIA